MSVPTILPSYIVIFIWPDLLPVIEWHVTVARLEQCMQNRYIGLAIGIAVAALAMYGIVQYLYTDQCLSLGGSIRDGICHHEKYQELYYVLPASTKLLLAAAGLLTVFAVDYLYKKR